MTGEENLDALAEKDFMKHWKEVVKELGLIFNQVQKEISDHYKGIVDADKNADKAKKAQERAAKKAIEAVEKAREEAVAARAIQS